MQQPISEANLEVIFRDFVSQNLVNWFLNPVSKMIVLHLSNQLVIFFVNIDVYFKSSEFWSSLLIIKAWVLTRSELAGFESVDAHFPLESPAGLSLINYLISRIGSALPKLKTAFYRSYFAFVLNSKVPKSPAGIGLVCVYLLGWLERWPLDLLYVSSFATLF